MLSCLVSPQQTQEPSMTIRCLCKLYLKRRALKETKKQNKTSLPLALLFTISQADEKTSPRQNVPPERKEHLIITDSLIPSLSSVLILLFKD